MSEGSFDLLTTLFGVIVSERCRTMPAFFPDGLCEKLGDLCSQERTVGSPLLTPRFMGTAVHSKVNRKELLP